MKELGIDRLSPDQKVALALEIWESLEEARPQGRLSAEQRAELARRDAELDANPEIALTWEQIRASFHPAVRDEIEGAHDTACDPSGWKSRG